MKRLSSGVPKFQSMKTRYIYTLQILFPLILLLASASFASNWSAADKAFSKGDFKTALDLYYKARTDAPDNRLLNYNIGSSLYKLNRYEEAKNELMQAAFSVDTAIAKKAAYNLANVHYRIGQAAQKPADKVAAWREAIAILKKAIDLDPNYDKAKRNAEYIQVKLKEELDKQKKENDKNKQDDKDQKPMSDAAKQALARAIQMCHQGRFAEAKALLEQTVQSDETASSLNAHIQRLQDIIDISEGREPSRPIDASNTDQDLQVI